VLVREGVPDDPPGSPRCRGVWIRRPAGRHPRVRRTDEWTGPSHNRDCWVTRVAARPFRPSAGGPFSRSRPRVGVLGTDFPPGVPADVRRGPPHGDNVAGLQGPGPAPPEFLTEVAGRVGRDTLWCRWGSAGKRIAVGGSPGGRGRLPATRGGGQFARFGRGDSAAARGCGAATGLATLSDRRIRDGNTTSRFHGFPEVGSAGKDLAPRLVASREVHQRVNQQNAYPGSTTLMLSSRENLRDGARSGRECQRR